jgi:hypothetical protein
MLWYVVLRCVVLDRVELSSVLFCSVLFCSVLFCSVLFCCLALPCLALPCLDLTCLVSALATKKKSEALLKAATRLWQEQKLRISESCLEAWKDSGRSSTDASWQRQFDADILRLEHHMFAKADSGEVRGVV